MKAIVLGGTTGMGRAIARLLVDRADRVFLMGIDEADLQRSAPTSRRGNRRARRSVTPCATSRSPTRSPPPSTRPTRRSGSSTPSIVTAAMFATQEALEQDIELTRRLVTVNYANTVVFCEHARKRLLARGGGRLVVFSSVAGDRGRKPVIIYGSSKAGIARYLEGLDHKFYAAGLRVLCVKPGFVKTGMTAGLKPPPFAGEPEGVAKSVVRAMDRQKPVIYAPPMWALVMLVIRWLPRFVMRRIGF